MASITDSTPLRPGRASLADFVATARPEQWSKHVLIVPGLLAAAAITGRPVSARNVMAGFAAACLLASSNYVLNEWLDAESDRHHPLKGNRPAAMGRMRAPVIGVQYLLLAAAGLALASQVSQAFVLTSIAFLAAAMAYNVPPIRMKDRVYLDVAWEAANNPLRLLLGWFMVTPDGMPPPSLLLLYWCGGAFLMATKRLAEYRYLVEAAGLEVAARYRHSFRSYDQTRLLLLCFVNGVLASFFFAIFVVEYRAELVLALPLLAWLFVHYLRVALLDPALVGTPEMIHRQRGVVWILVALAAAIVLLCVVDIPVIEQLVQSRFAILAREM